MFRKRKPIPSSAASGFSSRAVSSQLSSNGDNAYGTAGSAGGGETPHSPVLVQRLIILHDGLKPLPRSSSSSQRAEKHRRNPQAMLSENASLEEHGEFILYYYDHSLHFSQEGGRRPPTTTREFNRLGSNESYTSTKVEKPPSDYATEEAIRFAGLCRALRSLPLALKPENYNEENSSESEGELSETDVVHLKDSTLVFAPLELGGDIIAIAQIPRAHSQKQRAHMVFGADPSAIKEAVRHIHASFSLLFGGGIHRRLLRTKHLESSKDWVLEVIEDDEEEDSFRDSGHSDKFSDKFGHSDKFKIKEDSNWEIGVPSDDDIDDEQLVELVEKESSTKKVGSRQKSRNLRRSTRGLSSSFTLASNIHSSFKSEDSDQMKNDLEENYDGDYSYGGMEELFDLRREHRTLSDDLSKGAPASRGRFGGLSKVNRWASSSNAEDLFNDIANDFGHNDCERRIENLLKLLPITKLREDLVAFYDARLFRMQGVCEIMQGGVGRCLVNMVPSPICQGGSSSSARKPVRGQHPPLSPNAFVSLASAEFMKSLICEEVPKLMGRHDGRLSGMSMFYQDRLVLSQVISSNKRNKRGQGAMTFPPEIPSMIIEYFRSSHKEQIEKDGIQIATTEQKITQNANERPLTRWMSSLALGAAMIEDATAEGATPSNGNDKTVENGNASPGYVAHPSSPKDANGPINSLFVNGMMKHVWLQRVHLPCTLGFDTNGHGDETETYAALFESHELSFLLYFEMPSPQVEGALVKMAEELRPKSSNENNGNSKLVSSETQSFVDMLTFLADQLTEFCSTFSSHEVAENMTPMKEINSDNIFPGEPGIDIICIDRDESSFVLLSQHDLSVDDATSPAILGMFGIGSKAKDEQRPSRYSNMLDCRHKLASYLPLDVMLAFDDMFNEIGRLSGRKSGLNSTIEGADTHHTNNGMDNAKSIELCTFLPQGWVYSRAFGNVELYILLDTKVFVTINDVQKAVTRVRERVFNDKIR